MKNLPPAKKKKNHLHNIFNKVFSDDFIQENTTCRSTDEFLQRSGLVNYQTLAEEIFIIEAFIVNNTRFNSFNEMLNLACDLTFKNRLNDLTHFLFIAYIRIVLIINKKLKYWRKIVFHRDFAARQQKYNSKDKGVFMKELRGSNKKNRLLNVFKKLFTNYFIQEHTIYKTTDEFLSQSGLVNYQTIDEITLEAFIINNTKFNSFNEMLNLAWEFKFNNRIKRLN